MVYGMGHVGVHVTRDAMGGKATSAKDMVNTFAGNTFQGMTGHVLAKFAAAVSAPSVFPTGQ